MKHAEGPGFRLGDLELHPGIGIEGGYDTNVFYEDENEIDSFLLRVTPHLDLSTLGPQRLAEGKQSPDQLPIVAFRAGIQASYMHFFESSVRDDVGIGADLDLTFNPGRPISVNLSNVYNRTIRPFSQQGAIGRNYNRNRNDTNLTLNLASKGDVLTGSLGYGFAIDIFEGDSFEFANNLTHSVNGFAQWRFLPSTALLYDARFQYNDLYNDPTDGGALVSDAFSVRSRIGLNGAITPSLSALGMIGYAGTFIQDTSLLNEYDDVVAQAELRWKSSETSQLRLGYERDYFQALVGNFYRRDRGYLRFQVLFEKVLLLAVEGWGGLLDYGRVITPNGDAIDQSGDRSREDIVVSAQFSAEYRVLDWLAFTGNFAYLQNFTDFEFTNTNGAGVTIVNPAEFMKLQAWLGVRAFY